MFKNYKKFKELTFREKCVRVTIIFFVFLFVMAQIDASNDPSFEGNKLTKQQVNLISSSLIEDSTHLVRIARVPFQKKIGTLF